MRRRKHVKRILCSFFMAMCLLVLASHLHGAPQPQSPDLKKRVLIINSYHKGYPWTDNTVAGIESVLKDGKGTHELHIEYIDNKRVLDRNHFHRLFLYYRSKFDQTKFNLIIVSDNEALNFVFRYRDALFPSVPVVFCGVNRFNEILQQKTVLLTGVVEEYDIAATLNIALKLHPTTKEVIAVMNGNPGGMARREALIEALAAAGKSLKGTIIEDPVFSEFESLIRDKAKDSVILLLGTFKDKGGLTLPLEETTATLAKYDIPLYGVLEHYLGHGIVGGKLVSAYQQGARAAQMGLRILQGEPVDRVPMDRNSPSLYMFDYTQMVRFGIDAGALPEASVVINKPNEEPRQNDTLLWAAAAVSLCLGIIVILLVLFIRSRRHAEASLEKLSVDLEKRVEVRTEELMRSNADLRKRIAEMKQNEGLLSENQLKHWTLFQQAPTPIFIVDEEAHYVDCNAKTLEFFACTLDELRLMDARELIPAGILTSLFEVNEPAGQIRSFEATHEVQGETRTLLLSLVSVVLSGKRVVYGIGHDITGLKQSVGEVTDQKALLEEVINVLPAAILVAGKDGAVEYVSDGFVKILGFSRDDVPSMDILWQKACRDEPFRDSLSAAWLHAIVSGEPSGEDIRPLVGKITTKEGSVVEKELRFIAIHDGVVTVIQDVKGRKFPEDRVAPSRNHESIETLAAGIAHDFNNLLLVILGNISLAKTSLAEDDRALGRLIEAERASMLTKDLIQQLITFSKGGELTKRAMMIAPLIMDITRSILSNTNVKGKYIMSDDLFPVEIDEGQIRQVINIILRNAREAMPRGGTVTISFENVRITREDFFPLKAGDYVKISLEDEGSGIKKEHLDRIFDPYFTTKDVGSQKGVGLGLAIAYSIIKKHGGHIAVESAVGGGTTFHIYLPAYGKEPVSVGEPGEMNGERPKKKGKILVMDDAKAVRDVTGAMLGHMGYDVSFARDGREAIALYRQARDEEKPFDALILDLTVQGGMGGKEAMQLLLGVDPHLKAVISSGYSGDPIMSDYREHGFKAAIVKPYKMEELEEILGKLIREPA